MGKKSAFWISLALTLVIGSCSLKTTQEGAKIIEVPKLKVALVMKALNNPFFYRGFVERVWKLWEFEKVGRLDPEDRISRLCLAGL